MVWKLTMRASSAPNCLQLEALKVSFLVYFAYKVQFFINYSNGNYCSALKSILIYLFGHWLLVNINIV